MKTTLIINDGIMRRLKQRAAAEKRTLSELVEAALRLLLDFTRKKADKLPPLPSFSGGDHLVDISNRDALYDAMESDDVLR